MCFYRAERGITNICMSGRLNAAIYVRDEQRNFGLFSDTTLLSSLSPQRDTTHYTSYTMFVLLYHLPTSIRADTSLCHTPSNHRKKMGQPREREKYKAEHCPSRSLPSLQDRYACHESHEYSAAVCDGVSWSRQPSGEGWADCFRS